ncbi:CDK5RAP1-like protein [Toxocara canis]|uniref:CDK5RAP1-like protein n=1 Tax=Toxocara canis TaxID=6265 RepID=A0A0B2VMN6_TOXCA|nr:CDK5RAP1-like protein [Toxocara canis]
MKQTREYSTDLREYYAFEMIQDIVNVDFGIQKHGLDLRHFMAVPARNQQAKIIPSVAESDTYLSKEDYFGEGRKVKFVTYGCQMNINDMETVRSILFANGYVETDDERMVSNNAFTRGNAQNNAQNDGAREIAYF